jgi:hypothetical protein
MANRFSAHLKPFDRGTKAMPASTPEPVDLRSLLHEGEYMLWEGRPVREHFRRRMWPVSLVGLVFAAFSVLCTALVLGVYIWGKQQGWQMDWGGSSLLIFLMSEIPFVAAGLAIYFVPRILADRMWPTVAYALTDKRVLMRHGPGQGTVTEVTWPQVEAVTGSQGEIGRVSFRVPGHVAGPYAPYMYYRHGFTRTQLPTVPMFEAIERPQDVARIAVDAMNRAR